MKHFPRYRWVSRLVDRIVYRLLTNQSNLTPVVIHAGGAAAAAACDPALGEDDHFWSLDLVSHAVSWNINQVKIVFLKLFRSSKRKSRTRRSAWSAACSGRRTRCENAISPFIMFIFLSLVIFRFEF